MKSRPADNLYMHFDFIIIDLISLQVSFLLAFFVISGSIGDPYYYENNRLLMALMMACQILTILFSNNYEGIIQRGYYEELANILRFAVMMGMFMLAVLFVFQKTGEISRLQAGWTFVLYVFVDWAARTMNKRRIRRHNKKGRGKAYSMMVMVPSRYAEQVIDMLTAPDMRRYYRVSGVILTDDGMADAETVSGVPVYRMTDHTAERIRKGWVDEIFFYEPEGMPVDLEQLTDFTDMGICVHVCPEFLNSSVLPITEVNEVGSYRVLTSRMRHVSLSQVIIKRLMDIAGGIAGCLITLLLAVIIGPIIYIKSPGPIFFSQERIGRNGKRFRMYKFRSMYMDAEERKAALMEQNRIESGLMFKLDDDPRIIGSEKKDKNGKPKGIGNFIRNTSIDEFPQFWNVLKGDMSIVGTRPPLPEEWERYSNHHRVRMTLKPGVTGLWQVSGRSDITDFEEVVRLDTEYIETWTIKMDIKIIFRTIQLAFSGNGAR